jgi:hypothetical protein
MKHFSVAITGLNRQTLAEKAKEAVLAANDGDTVSVKPPTRNIDQNAKFHAICSDIANQCEYMGRRLTADQWKVLLVSGHSIATKDGADMMPGLEGEFVNLRESTARMTVKRLASLIEYSLAYGHQNNVKFQERPCTTTSTIQT